MEYDKMKEDRRIGLGDRDCLSGTYYSGPSRQLTPATAQMTGLTLQRERQTLSSKAGTVQTSTVAAATIQAQPTQTIARRHSFKTTPRQRSETYNVSTNLPTPEGWKVWLTCPKGRALPLVASYDRQALAVVKVYAQVSR